MPGRFNLLVRFQDRHLSLEFPNALVGRGKLGLLRAVETRELPGVDQFLLAPPVDGLVANTQIGSDLSDRAAGRHQVEHFAVEFSG